MRRVIVPMPSMLAAMVTLAGCASAPNSGPLSPIGDVSQTGADSGARGLEHDFAGVLPGGGGGVADGPAVPGGMRDSGSL